MSELLQAQYWSSPESSAVNVQVQLENDKFLIIGNQIYINWDLLRISRETGEEFILSYNSVPKQLLKFSYPEKIIEKYPLYSFSGNKKERKNGYKWLWILLITFILLIVGGAFLLYKSFPYLIDKSAQQIPIEMEDKLSKELRLSMLSTMDIDTLSSSKLTSFFNNLKIDTSRNCELYVVKGNEINAFAIPGNTIFVYDQMIRVLENEHQLSALLGHEFGHIKHRHALRSLLSNVSSQIFITVFLGNDNELMAFLSNNIAELQNLKYSRDFERESDEYSMAFLKSRKLNPIGMIDLFQLLEKESGKSDSSKKKEISILSTHPLTSERIEFAKKEFEKKDYELKTDSVLMKSFQDLKLTIN